MKRTLSRAILHAGGMTMVEVLFAGVVLLGAVVTMMSMFDGALTVLNFTTARSIATHIANEEIEDVRSLDYDQVFNRDPGSNWPADSQIGTETSPPHYHDVDDNGDPIDREFILDPTLGIEMERSVIRKNIPFTVRVYALWVADSTETTAYKRAIVKVSWERGSPGEIVLTTNYAKEDVTEPRPSVSILGVASTNYNYFIGAAQDTTMGMDDSIRGPISGEAITPVIHVAARANSAKATGIDRVEFALYRPDGSIAALNTDSSADAQGHYTWALDTNSYADGMGYLIRAEAFDEPLNGSDVATLRVNIDNTAPAVPSNLQTPSIPPPSALRVHLTWDWTASASDAVPIISRFVVERSPRGQSNYARMGAVRGDINPLEYWGADAVDDYTYRVLAVDSAGNRTYSSFTKDRMRQTPADMSDPSSVSTATARSVSWKAIDLMWSASQDGTAPTDTGMAGYIIEASDNQTNWIRVGWAPDTGQAYIYWQDTGLKPGKTYWYRPLAVDNEGNISAVGATASASTPLR